MNLTQEIINKNNLSKDWGIYCIYRNELEQIVLKGAICKNKEGKLFWPIPHKEEHEEIITENTYRNALTKGELF